MQEGNLTSVIDRSYSLRADPGLGTGVEGAPAPAGLTALEPLRTLMEYNVSHWKTATYRMNPPFAATRSASPGSMRSARP